jgi:hypothetical protein
MTDSPASDSIACRRETLGGVPTGPVQSGGDDLLCAVRMSPSAGHHADTIELDPSPAPAHPLFQTTPRRTFGRRVAGARHR